MPIDVIPLPVACLPVDFVSCAWLLFLVSACMSARVCGKVRGSEEGISNLVCNLHENFFHRWSALQRH
jgi:hypothetical protein